MVAHYKNALFERALKHGGNIRRAIPVRPNITLSQLNKTKQQKKTKPCNS